MTRHSGVGIYAFGDGVDGSGEISTLEFRTLNQDYVLNIEIKPDGAVYAYVFDRKAEEIISSWDAIVDIPFTQVAKFLRPDMFKENNED